MLLKSNLFRILNKVESIGVEPGNDKMYCIMMQREMIHLPWSHVIPISLPLFPPLTIHLSWIFTLCASVALYNLPAPFSVFIEF